MDELSRKRNVRGPYNVAKYIRAALGGDYDGVVTGSHWSQIFYGENVPSREVLVAFTEAFELSEEERGLLSWRNLYDDDPFPGARPPC